MNRIIIILCSLLSVTLVQAELQFIWMSHVLVPGESTQVMLIETQGKGFSLTDVPDVKNATFKLEQEGVMPYPNSPTGRVNACLFTYIPDKVGRLDIPAITVRMESGDSAKTIPQEIEVVSFDRIEWKEITLGEEKDMYGSFWYIPDATPYINQMQTAELKVYASNKLSNFNVPQIQSTSLAVGRFLPYIFNQSITPSGEALLKGKTWSVYTYAGTVSALNSGKVVLGPGSLDATVLSEQVNARWGQVVRQYLPVPLSLSVYSFVGKSLPSGAPKGFRNAVGQFSLTATTKATDLLEGEPISINIRVEGVGNLNLLSCPTPDEGENWKIYPANKLKGEENSGVVEYQLLMKPLSRVTEVPSFQLPYFNPRTEKYEVATTPAIPMVWKSTTVGLSHKAEGPVVQAPPAGIIPVEEMGDIMGLIPASVGISVSVPILKYFIGLFGSVTLFLLIWGVMRRYSDWKEQNKGQTEKLNALNRLTRTSNQRDFLRSLGGFVEVNIPLDYRTPEINTILEERDTISFQPNAENMPVNKSQYNAMLAAVRKVIKTLPALLFLCLLGSAFAQTEELALKNQVPSAGRYEEVMDLYAKSDFTKAKASMEEWRPDNDYQKALYQYTLGNIEYKLSDMGQAALAYRRALLIAPDFYEARRNLAFIERKEGVIPPVLTAAQESLSKMPYMYFNTGFYGALGLLCVVVAYMWARKRSTTGMWFFAGVLAVLSLGGLWAKMRYPLITQSIPAERQFIITKTNTSAWHDATTASKKVFAKLPAGTSTLLLAHRGGWNYVQLPNGVRAWVTNNSGETLSHETGSAT